MQLADVVDGRGHAALVAVGLEQRQRGLEVLAGFVERADLAVDPADAVVGGTALAAQIETIGQGQHLAERGQGVVDPPAELQHVAVVVQRLQALGHRPFADELEAALVVLCGLGVGVAGACQVAGQQVGQARLVAVAALVAVLGQHRGVFLVGVGVALVLEPIGDHPMEALASRRAQPRLDRHALLVVLEDVLVGAREGAVGQLEHVVALDQVGQDLVDAIGVFLVGRAPVLGSLLAVAPEGQEPAAPEHAAHDRRPLEQLLLLGLERREAGIDRVLDGQRQPCARQLVEIDLPGRLRRARRRLAQHADVVVDAHHLLEHLRITAGEGAGGVDQRLHVDATGLEQRAHHLAGRGVVEHAELDHAVAILGDPVPVLVAGDELRASRAQHQHPALQVLEQVAQ